MFSRRVHVWILLLVLALCSTTITACGGPHRNGSCKDAARRKGARTVVKPPKRPSGGMPGPKDHTSKPKHTNSKPMVKTPSGGGDGESGTENCEDATTQKQSANALAKLDQTPRSSQPLPSQTSLTRIHRYSGKPIRIQHNGKPGAGPNPDAIILKPGVKSTKPLAQKSSKPFRKPSATGKPIRILHHGKPGTPANPDAIIVKPGNTPTDPMSPATREVWNGPEMTVFNQVHSRLTRESGLNWGK
ncbi:hypothetical protein C8R43DRAFT_963252 [Mycena crocata]|nr:hypothetical protein C8R43DRAFT_963252 [Mycena crocata]